MASTYVRRTLFVSRLNWTICKRDLRKCFEKHGKINHATVLFDHETGLHKGFGFVTFSNANDAEKASKLKHVLNGNQLFVRLQHDGENKGIKPLTKQLSSLIE